MALVGITSSGLAQTRTLTTTYAASAGDRGEMFDIVALRDLSIIGVQFAFRTIGLTDTMDIYTKSGTYVGSEGNAAAWTLSASGEVTVAALNTPSPVFLLPVPIGMAAGERLGIYIRRENPNSVAQTNGNGAGTLEASDGNLQIFEGIGVSNAFGATIGSRIPNVTIHYRLATPALKIFSRKLIRTTERRVVLFGLVTDDVGLPQVQVRYKRQRANGSKFNAKQNLKPDANGVFRATVKTIDGRNPVVFTATDAGGRRATQRVVVVR